MHRRMALNLIRGRSARARSGGFHHQHWRENSHGLGPDCRRQDIQPARCRLPPRTPRIKTRHPLHRNPVATAALDGGHICLDRTAHGHCEASCREGPVARAGGEPSHGRSPSPHPRPALFFREFLTRLVTGCSRVTAEHLLGGAVSDTTLRARRDEWTDAGVFDAAVTEALAYDCIVGLDLPMFRLTAAGIRHPPGRRTQQRTPATGPNPAGSRPWPQTATVLRWVGPQMGATVTTASCSHPPRRGRRPRSPVRCRDPARGPGL